MLRSVSNRIVVRSNPRDPSNLAESAVLNPVSYTHLDVYKRQHLSNLNTYVGVFGFVLLCTQVLQIK